MIAQDYLSLLNENLPINSDSALFKEVVEKLSHISLKKGEILFTNSNNLKTYLIIKGSVVRFIITPSGEQRAIMFHTENFMPVIGNPYINNHNAEVDYFVKANENLEVLAVDFNLIENWVMKDGDFAKAIYIDTIKLMSVFNQIHNHHTGLTKGELLEWLIDNYSFIFKRFSSKDIANFMGITPIWLSKLKRKRKRKS